MIPGSPSIELDSSVTLPDSFKNQRFCLFYVQLVKCNAWGLKRYSYPYYEWVNDVHEEILDSSFPYNGFHCDAGPSPFVMKDTPGFPLSAMASAYAHMEFQTYLMFMPPSPKSDAGVVAVPLKWLKWQWKGAAQAIGEPFPRKTPPCGRGHQIVFDMAPAAYPHFVLDCSQYPEWKGTKVGSKPKSTGKMTESREELPSTDISWEVTK